MTQSTAYKVIQNDILNQIIKGNLSPGDRLPTEAELMKTYSVSRITVQRALFELKQQGLIVSRARMGTFIRSSSPTPIFAGKRDAERISIGVVAPFDMVSPGVYQYLDGILNALSIPRDNVALHNTRYVQAYDRIMLENCLKDRCSGIIYYPGVSPAPPLDLLMQIKTEGYPCVLIDKRITGIELPCVQTNNVSGEREIAEHLLKLGHRNIVFAAGGHTMSIYERYDGFCQAMHNAGPGALKRMYCSLVPFENDRNAMAEQVRAWIADGVTAVCCSADSHAREILDLCREMQVDVPRSLAITGFDGSYCGEITSMLQPYAQIGHIAAEMLLKWILTGNVRCETVEIAAQFIPGASTVSAADLPTQSSGKSASTQSNF